MGYAFRDVRPYTGRTVSSDKEFQTINVGNYYDFVSITGHGALKWAAMMVNSGTDSHKMIPSITVDAIDIEPVESLQALNSRGYTTYTRPIQLIGYGVNGTCNMIYHFSPELIFDVSLRIRATNGSATDSISVLASWLYYTL